MKPLNSYKTRKFFSLSLGILLALKSVGANRPMSFKQTLPDSLLPVNTEENLNKKKFWWVTGIHAAGYVGSLAALASVWYKDFDKTNMHAFNDMDEWGGMDKLGHVNTAWQLSNFSYSAYRYTGMKEQKAALVGSSFALLYQTTLEIFDGYSAKWGFSFGDMGANLLGAGMAYLRNTHILRYVQYKISWWETQYPPYRTDVLGKTIPEQMLKDYNGQTYWLSINFPHSWFKANRNWLCFSLGYSIDGYTGGKQNYYAADVVLPSPLFERKSEFFLSLDLDCSQFNIRKKWLRQVLKVFNVVKVPFPAIGINTQGKILFRPLGY